MAPVFVIITPDVPETESKLLGEVVPMPTDPFVVKVPLLVVVALPPTQRFPEMERLVVEALPRVVRPVTERVDVAVSAPPKNPVPEKYPLP